MAKNRKKLKNKPKNEYRTLESFTVELYELTKTLDTYKQMKIVNLINEECNRFAKEREDQVTDFFSERLSAFDRIITGALIELTDFSFNDIKKILEYALESLVEDSQKVKIMKKEGKGDYMAILEEIVDQIYDDVNEMIDKKMKKKDIINDLAIRYPKPSRTMLANAYGRILEERKTAAKLKENNPKEVEDIKTPEDVEKAINFIMSDSKPGTFKEETIIAPVVEVDINKPRLNILNKKILMDVEGQFGIYKIEDCSITKNDITYTSPLQVEEEFNKTIELLLKEKEEYLQVFKLAQNI